MLSRIILQLDGKVDFRQSSLLQGVLMEKISPNYAEFLHQMQRHPYSQYVTTDSKWVIQTLNTEAYEEIAPHFARGDEFILKHNGQKLKILDIKTENISKKKLAEDCYTLRAKNKFKVEFLTPTAFKQQKQYVILPDIRLVAQSLMAKYSASLEQTDGADTDTLNELIASTFITKHSLRSFVFPTEGQNIPGFVGKVTFYCNGTATMARYWRMLLKFGEFSGVGIKTSMGMGGFRMIED